jgi:hypothetical protein
MITYPYNRAGNEYRTISNKGYKLRTKKQANVKWKKTVYFLPLLEAPSSKAFTSDAVIAALL